MLRSRSTRLASHDTPTHGKTLQYSSLSGPLPLAIDQHRLLPPARRLVGAVDATHPAARPLLPLQQLLAGSRDATLPRRRLFRVVDPADELVPTERRQAFPQRKHVRIRPHCFLKVVTGFVDGTLGKSACHEASNQCDRRADDCAHSGPNRPGLEPVRRPWIGKTRYRKNARQADFVLVKTIWPVPRRAK